MRRLLLLLLLCSAASAAAAANVNTGVNTIVNNNLRLRLRNNCSKNCNKYNKYRYKTTATTYANPKKIEKSADVFRSIPIPRSSWLWMMRSAASRRASLAEIQDHSGSMDSASGNLPAPVGLVGMGSLRNVMLVGCTLGTLWLCQNSY